MGSGLFYDDLFHSGGGLGQDMTFTVDDADLPTSTAYWTAARRAANPTGYRSFLASRGIPLTPETHASTTPSTPATTTTGKSGGGSAYIPPSTGGGKGGGGSAYIPPAASPYQGGMMTLPAASDNTVLYVVGGVAVVGLLAAMMMMGGRSSVTANRGRRGRRSRRRGH